MLMKPGFELGPNTCETRALTTASSNSLLAYTIDQVWHELENYPEKNIILIEKKYKSL